MNYYQLPLTIKIYIKIYLSRYITSSGNNRAQNIPKDLEEQNRKIINTLLEEEPNKIKYEQELWKLENIGYEKTVQQVWIKQPIKTTITDYKYKEETNLYWHRGFVSQIENKLNLFKWELNGPDRNYWAEIIRKEEEQRKEEITQELIRIARTLGFTIIEIRGQIILTNAQTGQQKEITRKELVILIEKEVERISNLVGTQDTKEIKLYQELIKEIDCGCHCHE